MAIPTLELLSETPNSVRRIYATMVRTNTDEHPCRPQFLVTLRDALLRD